MKKKIKFKIEYTPLSDDRINRHKNFEGLMAAYVATPKPNVFKRWLNNRYVLFGSGLVVGITFSALMFWNNMFNDVKSENTNQISNEQTTTSQQNETNNATSTKPITSDNVNDVATINQTETESLNQIQVASDSVGTRTNKVDVANKTVTNPDTNQNSNVVASIRNSVKRENSQLELETSIEKLDEQNETVIPQTQSDIEISIETPGQNPIVKEETKAKALPPSLSDEIDATTQAIDSSIASTHTDSTFKSSADVTVANETSRDETEFATPLISDSIYVPSNDSSPRTAADYKTLVDQTAETIVDEIEKIDISNPFVKNDSLVNDAVATEEEEKKEKKKFKLFQQDNTTNDTFENRYAQVSFVTPLSTNGPNGNRYLHFFSLNVLQGNTGALKGVEIGGLANLTKGYAYGAQFGGLLNFVGGDVRGAQFGGLVNTSRSLQGVQFAGVTNVNQYSATGMQTASVVNVSIADSLFNGLQLAGAVNYNGGRLKGAQVSGAANVNLKQIDGGQISGAFNVAKKINGYQIGVINIANKMKGIQIGVINIADTTQGGSIGLINVSRNGQFSVDIWGSDFLQVNGGLKIGNQRIYNVYAFGFSPFSTNVPLSDSLISLKPSLPFGFGLGLGGHIPIRKAFVDIDLMTWTIHNRYFDWRGLNMLNQLRVTGGYRIHKYFGVYAGPVANVSVQDNMYGAFKEKTLYEYNGTNNSVRGWLGFVAGVQLF